MTDAYQEFIAQKAHRAPLVGFEPPAGSLPADMKPFQVALTELSLRRGRNALFEGTGLGKTVQELAWARAVNEETGLPVLDLSPLAVAEQTVLEAQKFDIDGVAYAACQDEAKTPIVVTNYDRAHLFDFSRFGGVVLDESSILKAHDGKTRQFLTEACAHIPYRLPATATPAPNDWTEIGQHSEFLGVMTAKEMLSMYFVHDGANRADGGGDGWRLKRHAEKDFWAWVASWAVMIRSPADLGYDESGYVLPPLRKHQITVPVDHSTAEWQLFHRQADTLQERLAIKRESMPERVAAVVNIVFGSFGAKLAACHGSPSTPIDVANSIKPTPKSGSGGNRKAEPQKKTASTCVSTEPPIPRSGSEAGSSKTRSTPGAAKNTPQTQSSPNNSVLLPGNAILPPSGTADCERSSASPPSITTISSNDKAVAAPSATAPPDTSDELGVSTSTIATKRAASGVFSARTATSGSGSSLTTPTVLRAPPNISWRDVDQPWLIWCHLNDEQDALTRAFGDRAFSVYGRMAAEEKVSLIHRWIAGERPIMISKPTIMGWGLNFQHCHSMAFVGLNDSFEQLYQAIRRCWRFGQTLPVDAYFVASELEGPVVANLDAKERDFEAMSDAMAEHMRDLTRAGLGRSPTRNTPPLAGRRMELPAWLT